MAPDRDVYLYSGCKNTFLVTFDDGQFPVEDVRLVSSLCKDVDGLLLIRCQSEEILSVRKEGNSLFLKGAVSCV